MLFYAHIDYNLVRSMIYQLPKAAVDGIWSDLAFQLFNPHVNIEKHNK